MSRRHMMLALAIAWTSAACAVSSSGHCDTEDDCATGALCVENLCYGGDPPQAIVTGPSQVALKAVATLDASRSTRADGSTDGLTYAWEVLSPRGASLEGDSTSSMVRVRASTPHGVYRLQLIVSDRGTASEPVVHEFKVANSTPVVFLKADPKVWTRNTNVQLDASTSFDPDGDALTYKWKLLNPANPASGASLISAGRGKARLVTGSEFEKYTVELVVSDGVGGRVREIMEQTLGNSLPRVDAGEAEVVEHTCSESLDMCTAVFQLAGTVQDVDGEIVSESVKWTAVSGPNGAGLEESIDIGIQNQRPFDGVWLEATATIATQTRSTPIAGEYIFELEAIDDLGDRGSAKVALVVGNRTPSISFMGEEDGPLYVPHAYVSEQSSFLVEFSTQVAVNDDDGDELTVEFLPIETTLPGVTVTGPLLEQTSPNKASYTISVETRYPDSLGDGENPLYEVKARVSDPNGGAAIATLPIVILK